MKSPAAQQGLQGGLHVVVHYNMESKVAHSCVFFRRFSFESFRDLVNGLVDFDGDFTSFLRRIYCTAVTLEIYL